jgi:hypothetical protein
MVFDIEAAYLAIGVPEEFKQCMLRVLQAIATSNDVLQRVDDT